MDTRQPYNQQNRKGFRKPTTTPTPDEIFDVWLPELTLSELRVLLYIVRRTFGFGKDADTISLNQICNGIKTKDGKHLDHGTGLSRTSAWSAVKKLEEKGLLKVDRVTAEDGVNEINVYSLVFEDETEPRKPYEARNEEQGVGQNLTHGSSKSEQGVGQNLT